MPDTSRIEQWLDQLPEEEIQRELNELQEQMTHLTQEIAKRREVLELKQRWRDWYQVSFSQGSPTATVEGLTEGGPAEFVPAVVILPPTGGIRERVLRVMDRRPDKEEWAVPELREALIANGWMADDDKALRSLVSALSRMTKEGRLERVRHGHYRSAVQSGMTALQSLLGDEGPSE